MAFQTTLQKINIGIGILISIILVSSLFLFYNSLHVFSGNNTEAIEILGILVQSSSALIAIVFAFFIFIGQTIIGKYISGTLDYVLNHRNFVTILVFYVVATLTISLAMWIFPSNHWRPLVDVSISLFLVEIMSLPFLFMFSSKLLSPKTMIDTILGDTSLTDQKAVKETMEKMELVFSIIYKLAENREYDGATYGLKSITDTVTSYPNEKNGFRFYLWVIPNYERIAVECFKFEPNITVFVISQFNELLNRLTKKAPFVLANACSRITTACSNIASLVAEKPYGESSLVRSYHLLQRIYVSKSLVDYGFSAYNELVRMVQIIEMMIKANVTLHLIGFELQHNCERLIKAEKYEMMQNLFIGTLNASPKTEFTLHTYVNIIFFTVPPSKKEIADELVKEIKKKFGHVDIQFEKTSDPSRSEIGVRNGVITIKSGNEEISEKVKWFKES